MTTKIKKQKSSVNLDKKVSCSLCGWHGTYRDCGFGHDDFYCPQCRKEGCVDPVVVPAGVLSVDVDDKHSVIVEYESGRKVKYVYNHIFSEQSGSEINKKESV